MRDTPIIAGATACLFSLALFLHWWLPVKWHTTRSDCLLSLEMSLAPNDLSHLSDAEFHALCPQGEHAPGPEPLSPAAQAIVAEFNDRYELLGPLEDNWQEVCLAAALRALADAVVPEETSIVRQRRQTRKQILSIATELENTNEH